jgi:hypothetical protein
VAFTEESYTSKTNFCNYNSLPKYGEIAPEFIGCRKHRGLYVSKDSFAVNAVNTSLNIERKIIPKFSVIEDKSLAARLIVISLLKT